MCTSKRTFVHAALTAFLLVSLGASEPASVKFIVNTERDTRDCRPGDGRCLDHQDGCSLRAAIEESNSAGQPARILLPAGRFNLGAAGGGPLSVDGMVILAGGGISRTSISGGGAIRLFHVAAGATLEVSALTLREGHAGPEGGGAIRVERDGILLLREVLLIENRSAASGGALQVEGVLRADGLAVIDCQAVFDGGAIRAGIDARVDLRNATLARNRAGGEGGGIAAAGTMILNNLTLVDNRADQRGGGLSGTGRIRVANSILARNHAPAGPDCTDGPFSLGYNLLGDPAACTWMPVEGDLFSVDPRLGPLRTHADDAFTFGLRRDSPALGAGNPAPAGGDTPGVCAAADQRGVARKRCSIGAYEPRPVTLRLTFAPAPSPMRLIRGRPSRVTVQADNHGDSSATSVRLRIDRADGWRVEESLPADCRGAEGCLLGDLAPGENRRFDIPVGLSTASGPALLRVSASAEEPEDHPGSARSELVTRIEADSDGDGVPDESDCRPFNPAVWTAAGEALALTVADGTAPALAWQPPAAAGTSQPIWYDVLRATSAAGFGAATCVASGITSTSVGDAPPADAYYLVRAHNLCGGPLGYDSAGTPIAGTACAAQTGQDCAADGGCVGGYCRDGVCCMSSCAGVCESCADPAAQGQCLAILDGIDPDNECSAQPASSCGTTGSCSGSRTCALYSSSTVCAAPFCQTTTLSSLADTCNGAGACTDSGTQNCSPYACSGATGLCRTSCTVNPDCAPGFGCASGLCKKLQGAVCGGDSECAGGFCTDGVCCEARCGGSCEKCNQSGRLGFCDAVAGGLDPDNECAAQSAASCGTTGSCSGSSTCALFPATTICVAATCLNSTTSSNPDFCSGFGACTDNGTQNCSPYACSGATGLCRTSCTVNPDCAPGFGCASGLCKKLQGAVCGGDSECAAGFCTDGVCCEARCGGSCEKCNQSGRLGFCDAVAGGLDPDNECATQSAASCGTTGSCSGSRICALFPATTICVAPFCLNSTTSSNPDYCSGFGACTDSGTQNCSPYACSGATGLCRTSCTVNPDCAPGFGCASGTCI